MKVHALYNGMRQLPPAVSGQHARATPSQATAGTMHFQLIATAAPRYSPPPSSSNPTIGRMRRPD